MSALANLRAWLTQRLRAWLLGPQLLAEISAAVQRVHDLAREDAGKDVAWRAVPIRSGARIELVMAEPAGCGFYIDMDVNRGDTPFQLFDPEGRRWAYGHNLEALKTYGEQLARQRCEFVPRPIHRDHWRH